MRFGYEASRHDAIENDERQRQRQRQRDRQRDKQLDDSTSNSEPATLGPNRPVRAKERGAPSSG